jgi:uncharacterized protein YkwD
LCSGPPEAWAQAGPSRPGLEHREDRAQRAANRQNANDDQVEPLLPLEGQSPLPGDVPSQSPDPEPLARRLVAKELVLLTNAERARNGLGPLRAEERLMAAAQAYAEALAPGACFDHTCPPIPALSDRVGHAGYTGWSWVGENIAAGDRTAAGVVATWMASGGHRANILKPEYNEIGVGVATGSGTFRDYWVQVFGTRHE